MNKLEEAAREYANKNYPKTPLYGDWKDDGYDEGWNDAKNSKCQPDFIAGAEWQAKQSPWISIEERLPEKDGLRVWVKSSCLNHQPLVYHKGKFYARLSDGAYDGSVTHWMPIPQ